jgi:hypothetical protein
MVLLYRAIVRPRGNVVGAYSFLAQPVITSSLYVQLDADSFYNPVGLAHTGFAFDGNSYTNGVLGETQASWFLEPQSTTRGVLQEFPTQILVLVDRASVTILDATTTALNLWMIFLLGDQNAFADNSQATSAGYVASSVTWDNGRLTIGMTPDAGSAVQSFEAITFDFVQDQVFLDTSV